jgi:hypothetical protein
MDLVELDRREAEQLLEAAAKGDADALQFFRDLFDESATCFLCDKAWTDEKRTTVLPHPTTRTRLVVLPYCEPCYQEPMMYRASRELRMLKAVWPEGGWGFRRPAQRKGR